MRRCAEASAKMYWLPVEEWGPSQTAYSETATKGSPCRGVTCAAASAPGRLAARPSQPVSTGTAPRSSPLRRDPRVSRRRPPAAFSVRPGDAPGIGADGDAPDDLRRRFAGLLQERQVRVRIQQPMPRLVLVGNVPGDDLHGAPPASLAVDGSSAGGIASFPSPRSCGAWESRGLRPMNAGRPTAARSAGLRPDGTRRRTRRDGSAPAEHPLAADRQETSISTRQWSLGPHCSGSFRARTRTELDIHRDANTKSPWIVALAASVCCGGTSERSCSLWGAHRATARPAARAGPGPDAGQPQRLHPGEHRRLTRGPIGAPRG